LLCSVGAFPHELVTDHQEGGAWADRFSAAQPLL
jgi:hypothetical protein